MDFVDTMEPSTEGSGPSLGLSRRVGRAVARWNLIQEGDRVLVGLSGGKDSLVLLHTLVCLRHRSPVKFDLAAFTAVLTGMDISGLRDLCGALGVPYEAREHRVLEVIRDRGERSPCSLCANMRRGLMSSWAAEHGFNKLALGHNLDDAVETLFLNLFQAGRLRSFQPAAFLSRSGVTVIRPLVLASADAIRDEAARLGLPVLKTPCPYAGHTRRADIRELLASLRKGTPDLYAKALNALEHLSSGDSWAPAREQRRKGA